MVPDRLGELRHDVAQKPSAPGWRICDRSQRVDGLGRPRGAIGDARITAVTNPASIHKTSSAAKTASTTFATGLKVTPTGGVSSLTNTGAFTINATANQTNGATATGTAKAKFDFGVIQTASNPAGTATATLTNSGAFTVEAVANAAATSNANANATITGDAIQQTVRTAFNAQAILTNSAGTMTLQASATANSGGDATADANLATGTFHAAIQQTASATGKAGSAATASLTNAATLNITANAVANGHSSVNAVAKIGVGISDSAQNATTALSTISNSGALTILSNASATGGTEAHATADIGAGHLPDRHGHRRRLDAPRSA